MRRSRGALSRVYLLLGTPHAVALSVALVVGALCPTARAEAPFALEWQAPAACGSPDRTRARLAELLGETPEAALKSALRARARVTPVEPERYRLELTLTRDGGSRTRTLHARTCAALSDAAALILALAINPEAPKLREVIAGEPSELPVEEALPVPARRPAPARVSVAELPDASAAPKEDAVGAPPATIQPERGSEPLSTSADQELGWRLGANAGVLFDTGVLPEATFGGFLGLVSEVERLRVALTGSVLLEREGRAEGDEGANLSAWLVSARGCYSVIDGGWDLGPCLGVELGRISGQGFGVSDPGEGSGPWLALLGGAAAGVRLEPVRIFLSAEAVVPPARPRFVLENVGEVHRPAPVAVRLSTGIELYFW